MKPLRKRVDRVLEVLLCTLLAVLVLDVLWQVFSRYVMGRPSSFTDELARYLMVWVGLLGAAYGVGHRVHLAVDILPNALGPRARRKLDLLIEACVSAFAVLVTIGGWRLVVLQLQLGQVSASLGFALGYVYIVLPLAGAAMVFYSVCNTIEVLRRRTDPARQEAPP